MVFSGLRGIFVRFLCKLVQAADDLSDLLCRHFQSKIGSTSPNEDSERVQKCERLFQEANNNIQKLYEIHQICPGILYARRKSELDAAKYCIAQFPRQKSENTALCVEIRVEVFGEIRKKIEAMRDKLSSCDSSCPYRTCTDPYAYQKCPMYNQKKQPEKDPREIYEKDKSDIDEPIIFYD